MKPELEQQLKHVVALIKERAAGINSSDITDAMVLRELAHSLPEDDLEMCLDALSYFLLHQSEFPFDSELNSVLNALAVSLNIFPSSLQLNTSREVKKKDFHRLRYYNLNGVSIRLLVEDNGQLFLELPQDRSLKKLHLYQSIVLRKIFVEKKTNISIQEVMREISQHTSITDAEDVLKVLKSQVVKLNKLFQSQEIPVAIVFFKSEGVFSAHFSNFAAEGEGLVRGTVISQSKEGKQMMLRIEGVEGLKIEINLMDPYREVAIFMIGQSFAKPVIKSLLKVLFVKQLFSANFGTILLEDVLQEFRERNHLNLMYENIPQELVRCGYYINAIFKRYNVPLKIMNNEGQSFWLKKLEN